VGVSTKNMSDCCFVPGGQMTPTQMDGCSGLVMKTRAGGDGEPNSLIEYLIYNDQGYLVESEGLNIDSST